MNTVLRSIVPIGALAIAIGFTNLAIGEDNQTKPDTQQKSSQKTLDQKSEKTDQKADVKSELRPGDKDQQVTLAHPAAEEPNQGKSKDNNNKKEMEQSQNGQNSQSQEDASLGVTLDPYSSVQPEPGVRISAVYQGGPAEKAKIEPGDRILKLNNQKVTDLQEIQNRVRELKPNDQVEVTIWSAGTEKEVKVQLGTRAEAMKGPIISTASYNGDDAAKNSSSRGGQAGSAHGNNSQNGPTVQQAIVKNLQAANNAEIELAKIAQQKADNADVKALAKEIISDHEALNKKLDQVGQQKSGQNQNGDDGGKTTQQVARVPQQLCDIAEQASQNAIQMTKDLLNGREGYNFDMAYLGQEIAAHTMLLAELKAIQSKGPSDLKEVIEASIQDAQSHLEKAKQISKELEKTPGAQKK